MWERPHVDCEVYSFLCLTHHSLSTPEPMLFWPNLFQGKLALYCHFYFSGLYSFHPKMTYPLHLYSTSASMPTTATQKPLPPQRPSWSQLQNQIVSKWHSDPSSHWLTSTGSITFPINFRRYFTLTPLVPLLMMKLAWDDVKCSDLSWNSKQCGSESIPDLSDSTAHNPLNNQCVAKLQSSVSYLHDFLYICPSPALLLLAQEMRMVYLLMMQHEPYLFTNTHKLPLDTPV